MQGPFIKSPILKITLGILFALAAIVLVLLVLLTEEARMEAQTASWEGRAIENGAAIYANNCASCHGPNGKGLPGVAPALNSHYFFTERMADVNWAGSTFDYVELTIAAGRPSKIHTQWAQIMPTWGNTYGGPLREDQVKAVTTYVMNWEREALEQTVDEDPWQPFLDIAKPPEQQRIVPGEAVEGAPAAEPAGPRDPETLFTNMDCAGCHNLDQPQTANNRGLIGPNLGNLAANAAARVPGMSAEEYVHESIVAPNVYIVEGYPSGIMPQNYQDRMSEEEIQAMVTWLLERSE
jgi:mono/diheme cytochrome c family protein